MAALRPGITGIILPAGGPSPPLAVPGIRLKAELSEKITAYLALFDGTASPPGPDDAQVSNPHGLLFRVNDPPWWIGQLKYSFEIGESRLPATITGGGWYHMMSFADQRFSADGVSLANPATSGMPAMLLGSAGVWAVFEQQLYRVPHSDDRGVGSRRLIAEEQSVAAARLDRRIGAGQLGVPRELGLLARPAARPLLGHRGVEPGPIDPDPSLDYATNFLTMLRGSAPTEHEAHVFDVGMILCSGCISVRGGA